MSDDHKAHHGVFRLGNEDVSGELTLGGSNTSLVLRALRNLEHVRVPPVVHGQLHDLRFVSCIGCVGGGSPTLAWARGNSRATSWEIIPHKVITGETHFDPSGDRVHKVWFSTGDIYRIFDDFDSFGMLFDTPEKLYDLLPKTIGERKVPIGPAPRIMYFAGTTVVVNAELPFGTFEVQRWDSFHSDSRRAELSGDLRVQLEFTPEVTLEECLSRVASVGQFLSLVAGRSQGITDVQFVTHHHAPDSMPFILHWSFAPEQADAQEIEKPSFFDIPLDGIRRPEEFTRTLEHWFATEEYALARARLYACRNNGNRFTLDRLVAAANMFDIRPVVVGKEVSADLTAVCHASIKALQALPRSDDRDSAIMALSRVGTSTLMKKVLARAAVVRGHFHFENLEEVLRQAVKCRNYFVHGPGDKGFHYVVVQKHVTFLTETLEFIFAAAELIECGWSGSHWRQRPHTGYHWFSRFLADYENGKKNLLGELEQAKSGDDQQPSA
jgi:hypothetical protein